MHENGLIQFDCEVSPGETASLKLVDLTADSVRAWAPGMRYRAQVRLRRKLSELRDNHLVKHPGLLGAARKVVRSFGWSAE